MRLQLKEPSRLSKNLAWCYLALVFSGLILTLYCFTAIEFRRESFSHDTSFAEGWEQFYNETTQVCSVENTTEIYYTNVIGGDVHSVAATMQSQTVFNVELQEGPGPSNSSFTVVSNYIKDTSPVPSPPFQCFISKDGEHLWIGERPIRPSFESYKHYVAILMTLGINGFLVFCSLFFMLCYSYVGKCVERRTELL